MLRGIATQGAGITLGQSSAAVTAPANTSENTLATITIPAGALGLNGSIRINSGWSFTNNANSKTMRIRFSGAAGTAYMSAAGFTTQVSMQADTFFGNRNSASSQVGGTGRISTGAGTFFTTALTTSAVDTTVDTTVVLSAEKASAGDTVTLEWYSVVLVK